MHLKYQHVFPEAEFMLRLGHIIYSNCFPPHAGIVNRTVDFPFEVINGIPSELNKKLYEGLVDISPSSSIEYAKHFPRYVLLQDISITSRNKVMSIILQSRVPICDLNKKTVALTTASATSVVLLKILLEVQCKVRPSYISYVQGAEKPSNIADAFLTIGDLALTQPAAPGFVYQYDLGELWHAFTGLPFVFALWQVNYKRESDRDLACLYDILMTSRAYGLAHLQELSRAYETHFNVQSDVLVRYWKSFSYNFGPEEQKGLLTYYAYAAEIGAIAAVPDLKFWIQP